MGKTEQPQPEACNTGKQFSEPAIQLQYEQIIGIFQGEAGRFWTRFNIFTAIELAGVLGVLSNLKILADNVNIFRYVMILFCLLSTMIIIIGIRGIMSHKMLLRMVGYVESQSKQLLPLVELSRKFENLPQYINFIVAVAISILFSLAWWAAFIYLEINDYHIIVSQ